MILFYHYKNKNKHSIVIKEEMVAFTLEYKRSDECVKLGNIILELDPNLPEYLVDICIAVHQANPLLYRDKKFNHSKGGKPVRGKSITDNKCDNKNECLD